MKLPGCGPPKARPVSGKEAISMEVILAKTAGFCFGVRRAVDTVYEQVEQAEGPIYTYGPIVHNETVVQELEDKGVRVLNSEAELAALTEGTVIIRAHGVGRQIYELLEQKGIRLVDATCPFVKKIHRIAAREEGNGRTILIIGNAKHPEVEGILEQLTGKISTQQMTELTYQVDVEGRTVDEVAREFLVSLGLLDA